MGLYAQVGGKMRLSIIKNALKITIIIAITILSMSNISKAQSITTMQTVTDSDNYRVTTVSFGDWIRQGQDFLNRGSQGRRWHR